MAKMRTNTGYTKETFEKFKDNRKVRLLIGSGLISHKKYKTDIVDGQRGQVLFDGEFAAWVTYPADFKIDDSIKDLDYIDFINPTAWVNNYGDVYFKSDGIKKASSKL